jgi:hypothetical protein
MNSIKFALGVLALTGVVSAAGCKTTPTTEDLSPTVLRVPALSAAHVAFLEEDRLTMVKRVKDVLADNDADPMAKDNARELLEKAYEVTGGKLPADWSLPSGFEPIRYRPIHLELADGPRLRVQLEGRVDDQKRIKAMVLARGSEVLIDWQVHVGRHVTYVDKDGMTYFFLESPDLPAFPEPGIMTLRLTLADGSVTDGWFINDHLGSTASPVITEPSDSGSVASAHPTVKWLPFRSPENVQFEKRELTLYLTRREDDGTYTNPWRLWGGSPDRTEAHIGAAGEGVPEVELPNGDYDLGVTYDESRRFGPMLLVRRSTRNVSFHVSR